MEKCCLWKQTHISSKPGSATVWAKASHVSQSSLSAICVWKGRGGNTNTATHRRDCRCPNGPFLKGEVIKSCPWTKWKTSTLRRRSWNFHAYMLCLHQQNIYELCPEGLTNDTLHPEGSSRLRINDVHDWCHLIVGHILRVNFTSFWMSEGPITECWKRKQWEPRNK